MKLKLKNNTYVNPITGEAFENAFITDGVVTDDPYKRELRVSFRLNVPVTKQEVVEGENGIEVKEVEEYIILAESTLIFGTKHVPTYLVLEDKTVDLFAYMKDNPLPASPKIEPGYPNYEIVNNFLFKDNIGDTVEINPSLPTVEQDLAKQFVLQAVKINGEAIGIQFTF